MPGEYDLIVDSREKDMTDEQYISMREQYDKKIGELGGRIRKLVLGFLCAFAASFALLYMRLLFGNNNDVINSTYILLAEFLLAVFFYDPKDDKKHTYEKDKRILLNAQKSKITAIKIRLGLVIGFGALFALLNIVWWAVFGFIPEGETRESSLFFFAAPAYAIDYDYIESEPIGGGDWQEEPEEGILEDLEDFEDFENLESFEDFEDFEAETGEIDPIIENSIILRVGSPKAIVNGEVGYIDESNKYIAPFIDDNGRTLVPVRFIAEALGYGVEIDFESESQKIMIYEDEPEGPNLRLAMFIGENTLESGELSITMDTAPVIADGRTFIPARPFAESLFMEISYAQSERIIIITGSEELGDADQAAKKAADGLPVWPLDMAKVLKEWKNWPANPDGSYHAGADFAIAEGSEVYAAYSGTVEDVLDLGNSSYGKYIIVRSEIHGKTRYIYYAHLSFQSVKKGEFVRAGEIIGKTGSTGNSTGPHLHYEVRDENKNHGYSKSPSLNPYDYLP